MVSGLAPGRFHEASRGPKDATMVEIMIHRAVRPSPGRDQRALIWTVKSLTDDNELKAFVAGISDALWGPNGRNYKHDHLIRALLKNPEVHLGDRIVELMRHSNSGLLPTEVAFRHKVSCLKALWSICTLAERGTELNLPLHDLTLLLASWKFPWSRSQGNGLSNDREPNTQLGRYLPAVQAVLARCILIRLQRLKTTIAECEAKLATEGTVEHVFNVDDARAALNQQL